MSHTYKILTAKLDHDHALKDDMIDVHVQVYLDKKKLEVRRFSFDLNTSEKAIHAELDRFVATLNADSERAVQNAKHEERQRNANKTINTLTKGSKKDN